MKILKAIQNSMGIKQLIITCNCGETFAHPLEKERINCPCDKKITSSKKMLIRYYKNKQTT